MTPQEKAASLVDQVVRAVIAVEVAITFRDFDLGRARELLRFAAIDMEDGDDPHGARLLDLIVERLEKLEERK